MSVSQTKGQSAIEYLMTYGWMLLVVAVVGGTVFSLVSDQEGIESVNGFSETDIMVNDYGVNSEGLTLDLRSATTQKVNITRVTIKDSDTGLSTQVSPNKIVDIDDGARLELKGARSSDDSGTYEVEIQYNSGDLENLIAEGSITGSLDVFNRVAITEVVYNYSKGEAEFSIKNEGDNSTESISYTVESTGSDYTGSTNNLNSGEEGSFSISISEPRTLQAIDLSVDGEKFTDSNSDLEGLPSEELVAYWPMNDEQTENGWSIDLLGDPNGSIEGNTVTSSKGKIGGSYSFDGSGDYVENSDEEWNYPICTSFWLNPRDVSSNKQILIESGYSYNNDKGWMINHQNEISVCLGGFCYTPFSSSITEDEWIHILVNINSSGEYEIFKNGESLGSYSSSNSGLRDSGTAIASRAGGLNYLNGKMDEVRIYNRTLSHSEIDRLYSAQSEAWSIDGLRLVS